MRWIWYTPLIASHVTVPHSVGSKRDAIARKEYKLVWLSVPSPSISRLYVECHHKDILQTGLLVNARKEAKLVWLSVPS